MLMRRQTGTRRDDPPPARGGSEWMRRVLATVGGTLFGLLTSLYSAELREILEASGRGFVSTGLPVAITAVAASVSGVLIYELGFRRRFRGAVTEGAILIRADALNGVIRDEDAVVGRSLRYLETKRFTEDLVVFLHGLGLDAEDFRPYMSESRFHCVALTLYGFNADERDNDQYRPISLASHVQLVGYALRRLQRHYPHKRITLVGFSFGADTILCLQEFAPAVLRELRLERIVLLDPNVNNTTTTISSRIADIDSDRSLRDLVGVLRSAKTSLEFRYLCEYLSQITSKNFAHVRRHAREMSDRYRQRSFGPFLDTVGALTTVADRVDVVLSLNHEEVFNSVARAAADRGLDINRLECSRTDHFDLMSQRFLKEELEHPR